MQETKFQVQITIGTVNELTVQAISDPSEILELEDVLDDFTKKWSKNPFLLTGFISQFMKSNRTRGWTPYIFIVKSNEMIVGTVPLMIKKRLEMRFAQFFMDYSFSPDFVVEELYREACIKCVFEYLFKKLNCSFVSFHLPSESPNLEIIEEQCKLNGIDFSSYDHSKHFIIPVECSWEEFQGKKGRRRIIRQIERKLDELGEWEVEYFDDISDRPDLFGKILNVEKRSWKGHTPKVLIVTAEEILMALSGSQIVAKSRPEFKCSAWFLQINGKAVAYTYVIKYRGRALIHKTAYDDTYRKSYVGKYIMNIAIRDMFNEGQVKTIDFMGDFAFMEFWTSLSSNYVKIFLRKGNVAPLVKSLKVFNIVLDKLPDDKKPRFLKTLF